MLSIVDKCNTRVYNGRVKGGEIVRARGRPILTLRLGPEIIAALKLDANRHGLTVSDLLRQLIDEQLERDGISTASKPIDGQMSM